jgi:hypothetical protein
MCPSNSGLARKPAHVTALLLKSEKVSGISKAASVIAPKPKLHGSADGFNPVANAHLELNSQCARTVPYKREIAVRRNRCAASPLPRPAPNLASA